MQSRISRPTADTNFMVVVVGGDEGQDHATTDPVQLAMMRANI
jgi:hypothetical protein